MFTICATNNEFTDSPYYGKEYVGTSLVHLSSCNTLNELKSAFIDLKNRFTIYGYKVNSDDISNWLNPVSMESRKATFEHDEVSKEDEVCHEYSVITVYAYYDSEKSVSLLFDFNGYIQI